MFKPKAPKDMTAPEFVAYYKEKQRVPDYACAARDMYDQMVEMLSEPAPNPFTPDQIAWMREEQRTGMQYAYLSRNGFVFCCSNEPKIHADGDLYSLAEEHSAHKNNFLSEMLGINECILFADYAPLEGDDK